jgi:Domain of unknown function (DUF6456)
MPKINRATRMLAAAEARTVLARLVEDGAYAVAAPPAGGTVEACVVYSPCNAFAQPVAHASRAAIACALRKGWLDLDAALNRLRISQAGLQALRAHQDSGEQRKPRQATSRPAGADTRMPAESAFAWLRRRRDKNGGVLITDAQFNAGEKLAADFWHAQMSPRATANWSAAVPGQTMRRSAPGLGVDMRDAVVAARHRVHRALEAVGPELACRARPGPHAPCPALWVDRPGAARDQPHAPLG